MIYGRRVRLRRLEREDLPRCVEWLNDPEVRNQLAVLYPLGAEEEQRWYTRTLDQDPTLRPLAIDARPEAGSEPPVWHHVGVTALHQVDWTSRTAETGIFIGERAAWGRGLGSDAVATLVRWCFEELNLNRVWLRVYEDNARAIRCYEKVGFRHEGRLRQDHFSGGRYQDTLLMGLLRDEFRVSD